MGLATIGAKQGSGPGGQGEWRTGNPRGCRVSSLLRNVTQNLLGWSTKGAAMDRGKAFPAVPPASSLADVSWRVSQAASRSAWLSGLRSTPFDESDGFRSARSNEQGEAASCRCRSWNGPLPAPDLAGFGGKLWIWGNRDPARVNGRVKPGLEDPARHRGPAGSCCAND